MKDFLKLTDALGDPNGVEIMLEEKVIVRSNRVEGKISMFGMEIQFIK